MSLLHRESPVGKPVSLFVTCIVDQIYPQIGLAAAELLERHGIRVFTCPDIEAAGTYLRMLERGPA